MPGCEDNFIQQLISTACRFRLVASPTGHSQVFVVNAKNGKIEKLAGVAQAGDKANPWRCKFFNNNYYSQEHRIYSSN